MVIGGRPATTFIVGKETAALAAHDAVRSYLRAIRQKEPPAWGKLPQAERNVLVDAASMVVAGLMPDYSALHDWLAGEYARTLDWRYGANEHRSSRRSPLMVPSSMLEPHQRVQRAIHLQVVWLMNDLTPMSV